MESQPRSGKRGTKIGIRIGTAASIGPRDVSAHLAVAHVLVRGETDSGAVGKDRAVVAGTLGSESVHSGRLGDVTSVVLVLDGVLAPAIEDANKDGLFLGNHGVSCELHVSVQDVRDLPRIYADAWSWRRFATHAAPLSYACSAVLGTSSR